MGSRLVDCTRYAEVAAAFGRELLRLGGWVGSVVVLLVVYAALVGRRREPQDRAGIAAAGVALALVLGGYTAVFLVTPRAARVGPGEHAPTAAAAALVRLRLPVLSRGGDAGPGASKPGRMRRIPMKGLVVLTGMALLVAAVAQGQPAARGARAELRNAQGDVVGRAILMPEAQGVRIALEVERLPPGPHGFHVHAVGRCDAPDFASAGGHFNPDGKKHGLKNPAGPHAGDLATVVVGADGGAKATATAPGITLGSGPSSVFHPGGTALVIHAGPDDDVTDPAGNSGARIACGVITP
jgi:superoxide dismutase, Cu-Zn family